MNQGNSTLGLVLTGGVARSTYQAGALAELLEIRKTRPRNPHCDRSIGGSYQRGLGTQYSAMPDFLSYLLFEQSYVKR